MTTFLVAATSDLTKPMAFRCMSGRALSAPITLSDLREVRLFIVDAPQDGQPLQINVVDENGGTLAQAYVLENATQIFASLGLLVNVTAVKTNPATQETVK